MNFVDIFKNDFLPNYTSGDFSIPHIAAVLALSCMMAAYIFFIYRLVTKKTFYNKNFNIAIAAIAVITAAIILAVQSSIVISLGMVGALSIVRFRTAIKDPVDLCFLFWSLAVGICCGAHMVDVAGILCILLTILILILEQLPIGRAPMILIVNLADSRKEPELTDLVKKFSSYQKVKSRNVNDGGVSNLIMEVRVKEEYELVQAVSALDGITKVSLVSHDGEVTF